MSQTKKTYSKKLSSAETAVLAWFLIDAATHLFCELPFVIHSLTTTVNRATHWSAILWKVLGNVAILGIDNVVFKEYAKADPRWGRFHDCTVALEVPTSILWGPLSLACAYGVYYKKPWRFYWQTILSLGELYGNWMTFGPEWLNQYMLGTTELDPQGNWVHKWIYLFFANIVWVIIPILLLVESTRTITAACAKAQAQHLESYHLGFWSAFLIVLTLSSFFVIFVMFAILLPLGLLPTIVL